jgi:hypothetical protein
MNDPTTTVLSAAERATAEQRRLFEATARLEQTARGLKDALASWCDLISEDAEQRLGIAVSERDAQLDVLTADPAYGQALDIWQLADHATHELAGLREALRTYARPEGVAR